MHDDDSTPLEEAEAILAAENDRRIASMAAVLVQIPELLEGIGELIGSLAEKMRPFLEEFEALARYEADALEALEDDFYRR